MSKIWYQSKTLWFNIVTALVVLSGALEQVPVLADNVNVMWWGGLFLVMGNAALRFLTKSPVHLVE